MTLKMSVGLKRKVRLTDKLPQLPGYLPEQVACAVTVRLGEREGRKMEPDTSDITVSGQHFSPSLAVLLSVFPPNPKSLVKQWGPFSVLLTGPSFLRPSLFLPTDG